MFLDSLLAIIGTNCQQLQIDLRGISNADVVSDRLGSVLLSLERNKAAVCVVGILKCVTQSVMAPFVVVAKQASVAWPFNSIPNSWTCTVLVETAETPGNDHIIVRHAKSETGREPNVFTFRWAVDFYVSRATGEVIRTKASVVEHSCRDEKIAVQLQNMFA